MWGFQSIRDSVQNHANGLFRNISDRVGGEYDGNQNNMRGSQRDAMKNVVTPKSIPQFTLPPLFNQDTIVRPPTPEIEHLQREPSRRRTRNGVPKSTDTQECQNRMNSLKISQWDHESLNDEVDGPKESPGFRHRKPGSASSFSIKALMQKKKTESKNGSTANYAQSWRAQHEHSTKTDHRSGRELSVEQPGLGLQHLVATKSGFSTLSESPNTRRKESLFLSEDKFRKCNDTFSRKENSFRSRSPGSDGYTSSTRSSPRESPIPTPRKITSSKSERRHKYRKNLEVESQNQRRLSFNGESENHLLSSSDTDDRSLSVNPDQHRLSSSEQNVSNTNVSCSHSPPSPSIRLCITYLAQHRRLNVSILEGKNFVPKHSVYLKVSLLPRHDRGHRTEPIKIDDANPNIRERLTFESVEEEDIPHMSLKICCKEKSSRIRHADIVGECILALCDINFKTPNDIWINFNPYEEEEAPHIQLSLCYDAMLGCLTVDVVAARNVPKGSLGRQPDCFVTLTEILPNVKIAKKQTKIVHRTQDPVFHESFLFSLCTDAQTPDELVIVATLYVKDRVRGTTEAVGEALLGQLVDNWSGRSQWAQALAKEGEAVTHWHALVPQST